MGHWHYFGPSTLRFKCCRAIIIYNNLSFDSIKASSTILPRYYGVVVKESVQSPKFSPLGIESAAGGMCDIPCHVHPIKREYIPGSV